MIQPDETTITFNGDSNRLFSFLDVVSLAVASGAGLWYVELLFASGDPYWLGGTAVQWLESLVGLLVYATVIGALDAVAWLVVRRRPRAGVMVVLANTVVVLSVWSVLRSSSAEMAFRHDLAFLGTACAFTFVLLLLSATTKVSIRSYCQVGVVALVGAAATLHVATGTFFLHPERTALSTSLSLAWAGLTMVLGMLVCVGAARRRWGSVPTIVLITTLVALPPVALVLSPNVVARWSKATKRSVILVTADTLRADYCSTYGGQVPMPNLDALARRGVLFDQFYALAPRTIPSLDALFAGKYPPSLTPGGSDEQHTREETAYREISEYWYGPDGHTLPGRLGVSGYTTIAIVASPFFEEEDWLKDEFDHFIVLDSLEARVPRRCAHLPFLAKWAATLFPGLGDVQNIDSTAAVTWYALKALERYRNGNLFLWVHYMDPHSPFDPPGIYRTKKGPWPRFPPHDKPKDAPEGWQQYLWSDDGKAYVQSLYEGEMRYVDAALGRIVRTYDRLGMGDRAYLMFSSDHGEEFWDHGLYHHGHTLFNELLRVPLVVCGSGLEPGVVQHPVSAIDLMPTVAELLAAPPMDDSPGASFVPLLTGEGSSPPRPVFSQATHLLYWRPEPQQAVVQNPWKLIRGLETGTVRLYNIEADPAEKDDLAEGNPEKVAELAALLDEWSESFPHTFTSFRELYGSSEFDGPSEEMTELLRAGGYL